VNPKLNLQAKELPLFDDLVRGKPRTERYFLGSLLTVCLDEDTQQGEVPFTSVDTVVGISCNNEIVNVAPNPCPRIPKMYGQI